MSEAVEIVEIGERPPTGVSSRPFYCVDETGIGHFVKLGTALPDEKIMEWMFGFLAGKIGLPTPTGTIVSVTRELSLNSAMDTSEFGHGLGYGSKEVMEARDLAANDADQIPPALRAEILLFDWLILNEDRKMGELGGNPNILITPDFEVSIIDHGNALDKDFDVGAFLADHAFHHDRCYWTQRKNRELWMNKLKTAIDELPARWKEIPESWLNSGATIEIDELLSTVSRVFDTPGIFWEPFNS